MFLSIYALLLLPSNYISSNFISLINLNLIQNLKGTVATAKMETGVSLTKISFE